MCPLADEYAALVARFPHIKLIRGCCGTDIRHIQAIVEKLFPHDRRAASVGGMAPGAALSSAG